MRRLRAIQKSVSTPVFTSIVHASLCSRIDYCNSVLIGLPVVRLSPDRSHATARLIVRHSRLSQISSLKQRQ